MGKRGVKKDGKLSKSQAGKKKEIEKLVLLSKRNAENYNPQSETKARMIHHQPDVRPQVQLPNVPEGEIAKEKIGSQRKRHHRPQRSVHNPMTPIASSLVGVNNPTAKEITLILDRRDLANPEIGLVLLPQEPQTPRFERHVPSQPFNFFALPGEIRNRVYDLIIKPRAFNIKWLHSSQKSKSLTHYHVDTYLSTPRSRYVRLSQESKDRRIALRRRLPEAERKKLFDDLYSRHSPCPWLYVNRQMHNEAASVFYSKADFSFSLMGTLRHFLNHLTPPAKAGIRNLQITYNAYGHPARTSNRVWKQKHDQIWDDLCWRVSDECPSLTNLGLDLNYRKSPLRFLPLDEAHLDIFATEWMLPFWAFQSIGLKTCYLRIRSDIVEDTVLRRESRRVRQEILGREWDPVAEREKNSFGTTIKTRHSRADNVDLWQDIVGHKTMTIDRHGNLESVE